MKEIERTFNVNLTTKEPSTGTEYQNREFKPSSLAKKPPVGDPFNNQNNPAYQSNQSWSKKSNVGRSAAAKAGQLQIFNGSENPLITKSLNINASDSYVPKRLQALKQDQAAAAMRRERSPLTETNHENFP